MTVGRIQLDKRDRVLLIGLDRPAHLMLVYRIIGTGTPSLKGKHSDLLESGRKQSL